MCACVHVSVYLCVHVGVYVCALECALVFTYARMCVIFGFFSLLHVFIKYN